MAKSNVSAPPDSYHPLWDVDLWNIERGPDGEMDFPPRTFVFKTPSDVRTFTAYASRAGWKFLKSEWRHGLRVSFLINPRSLESLVNLANALNPISPWKVGFLIGIFVASPIIVLLTLSLLFTESQNIPLYAPFYIPLAVFSLIIGLIIGWNDAVAQHRKIVNARKRAEKDFGPNVFDSPSR